MYRHEMGECECVKDSEREREREREKEYQLLASFFHQPTIGLLFTALFFFFNPKLMIFENFVHYMVYHGGW